MENTDYYSLSGYLALKSLGAFSWIVSTRRYWCVLNETLGSMDFFNSERDLIKERKKPIDRIFLLRAALSLNQNEDCVFIILTNGKEYHLQAENHEALMVWLVGLQTKRDFNRRNQSISDSINISSDVSLDESKTIDRKTIHSSTSLCDICSSSLCVQCQKECSTDRTRSSSDSIGSSDSAFYDQQRSQRANSFQETFITLKNELDLLMNKETLYQTIIKEKSESIRQLEIYLAEDPTKNQILKKILDERCRTTNNELKFLHNEIVKLSRLIRDDELKIDQLIKQSQSQEIENQRLQRDYLCVLRSILCDEESRLIGGAKHRQRLKQMLNECRQRDPSLPTIDSLEYSGLYVDQYGFKHEMIDEHERMQYICMKLVHFYDEKTTSINESMWRTLLHSYRTNAPNFSMKIFKKHLRQGLPNRFRSEYWRLVIEKNLLEIRQSKDRNYFQYLCDLSLKTDLNIKFEKQISLDLNRTMPNHLRFASTDSDGIRQLRQILRVFCLHNSQIGYCQGMNFLVAIALLFLDVENAFWLLVLISEHYLTNYYHQDLIGAQVDQYVLKDLLKEKAPDLHEHFEKTDVDLTSITLNWFLAIFIDSVPFESLLRIWDCFLFEGPKILFRLTLAILILNRENILHQNDTISMIRSLKQTTKYCLDIDQLFQIAFEDLKPFCHRRDLSIKQNYWQKILIEKLRRKTIQIDDDPLKIIQLDCVARLPQNRLCLAFGSDFQMLLYEVEIERGFMFDLGLRYPSRAFSMESVEENLLLIGTLSGHLVGWKIEQKQFLWSINLQSCVHSLFSITKTRFYQIYCGLANGNLAIVQFRGHDEPRETFYLSLDSSSSILHLHLYRDQLWCLTSRKIIILNEKTLDIISHIYMNDCYIDTSNLLSYHANDFIWILHRSKNNTLQAWHPISHQLQATICLNQIFDRLGKTCEQMPLINDLLDDDDDTSSSSSSSLINEISITSFLISDEQLWIGTSTGILYVFDYKVQLSNKTDEENKQHRSLPSDSGLSWTENESTGELIEQRSICHQSTTTLTSIESCETSRSSVPLTDESNEDDEDHSNCSRMKCRSMKTMETLPIGSFEFKLSFKAKIADSPVKYLNRTNSLPLLISCSGQLGDDEIVCRWHRIGNTNQWTNDVIVELSSETMLPIRPSYACREYQQKGFKARSTSS